ncbi:hypothetical protein ACFMPD_10125 [Sedimentitalea sp. HM32M-2]|uniref:hypothetical protein n=1 Tax=Sedimentitalea sp. HM32M-2 TaxID=3351566 RepID=UPI0036314186
MRFPRILLAIALCATAPVATPLFADDDFTRITSDTDFRKLVVGKKVQYDWGYVVAKRNGALRGEANGKALKGAWAWRDGFWCRTLETHRADTDCQVAEINGKQVRFTRKRGKGTAVTGKIK